MRYEGRVFRPPSEAHSLIVQVTIGCSHNRCTFCSMYKEKKFRLRDIQEILEDFSLARKTYQEIPRIFLADGDALAHKTDVLCDILEYIKENIPECTRVTSYGSPGSILRKTPQELRLLSDMGLQMIYMGLESGSEHVLKSVSKGETPSEIIRAAQMVKDAGMRLSVTAISGLGGKSLWEEHAVETGRVLGNIHPDYIGLLTLMLEEDTPLYQQWSSGKFQLLDAYETALETKLLLENLDSEGSVFRANHASNYLLLRGTLNQDKPKLITQLEEVIAGRGHIRRESSRAL